MTPSRSDYLGEPRRLDGAILARKRSTMRALAASGSGRVQPPTRRTLAVGAIACRIGVGEQHERGSNMRIALAAAVLLVAQCLSACGAGAPSGPAGVGGSKRAGAAGAGPANAGPTSAGPTSAELMQALEKAHPGHPVVTAALDQCQEGRVNDKPVQVCDFCFVAVSAAFSDNTVERGMYLKAVRKTGSAVFRSAISVEQPSVEPAPGQRGVWLASNIRLRPGRETKALTGDLMRRAGHRRRPGFRTFVKWG